MDHRTSPSGALIRTAAAAILVSSFLVSTAFAQISVQSSVTVTATVPGARVPPPPPAGGGGGGGGGGDTSPIVPAGEATVVFTGRAYPGSTVTLLQNNAVRGTTIAGSDATFAFTAEHVAAGTYTFSLYSTDMKGTQSARQNYPVQVTANLITSVSGIFIAPTISVDKSSVSRGEPITILGQTNPDSTVSITIHSSQELDHTAKADKAGLYAYTLITSPLEDGTHEAQSRSSFGGMVSAPSSIATFSVGKTTQISRGVGDFNNDAHVNLVDFSILAYWYRKQGPPARLDLNKDGQVTIVDFSILAYHWTG